jgi:hypothetical protein
MRSTNHSDVWGSGCDDLEKRGVDKAELQDLVCIWICRHHPTSTDDIVRWEGEIFVFICRRIRLKERKFVDV